MHRKLSLPQGCPWSMTEFGLLTAAWIGAMRRSFRTTTPRVLADNPTIERNTSAEVAVGQTFEDTHLEEHVRTVEVMASVAEATGAVLSIARRETASSPAKIKARAKRRKHAIHGAEGPF
eukprot:15433722-Alexandrium_andersonii.AAC.1